VKVPDHSEALRERYLELLAGCLLGTVHQDVFSVVGNGAMPPWRAPVRRTFRATQRLMSRYGYEVAVRRVPRGVLEEGRAWPLVGETMVGAARLRNVWACLDTVLREGLEGDFIEAGVWRGGCCIYAAAVLETSQIPNGKRVFVADSFQGLPEADHDMHPQESRAPMSEMSRLAVSRPDVEENFRRYGVERERVSFVEGWFDESLPLLREQDWSVIRLDGDMYSSTLAALSHLYPQLVPGGFVIIDDYWEMDSCRSAVDDFRQQAGVNAPLVPVDHACVMWRRPG